MPRDVIMRIRANAYGQPDPHSDLGHFVRITQAGHFTPVNQLAAGGAYPHADCGEAVVESILIDRGHPTPIRTIEGEAQGTATGTFPPGLMKALEDAGISATENGVLPAAGNIMNPLGGLSLGGAHFPAYAAAYGGVTIDVSDPPAPLPAPAPAVHIYVVQAGDTESSIAVKFRVRLADLERANLRTNPNPNMIFPGQRLIIPAG